DFMATPSSERLINIASAVQRVGTSRLKPSVYLSPIAQPTSNRPARTRITHAIRAPTRSSFGRHPRLGEHLSDGRGERRQRLVRVARVEGPPVVPGAELDGPLVGRIAFESVPRIGIESQVLGEEVRLEETVVLQHEVVVAADERLQDRRDHLAVI